MKNIFGMQEVTFEFLKENQMDNFDNYIFSKIFSEILMTQKVSPIEREIKCRKFDPRIEILNPNLQEEDKQLVFLLTRKGVVRYIITII